MAFYRKNIAGAHQAARIICGLVAAGLAFILLSGSAAWLVAASGLAFALTGIFGYCPLCAVARIGGGSRS
jgi:hypothetical protein